MTFSRLAMPAAAVLLLVGCVSSPGYRSQPRYNSAPVYSNPPPASSCYECGTVIGIERSAAQQTVPGAGAVLGGIVGAVVGKEIGRSFSGSRGKRNVSAVAGAAGGAMVGNAIQNQFEGAQQGYVVHVRMHDGRTVAVHLSDPGDLQQGTPVRVQNGQIYID